MVFWISSSLVLLARRTLKGCRAQNRTLACQQQASTIPTDLRCTLIRLRCTELRRTHLSSLHFTELLCNLLSYADTKVSGLRSVHLSKWKKMPMAELVWYWSKGTISGIGMLRYRPEITDAWMPTPIGCPPLLRFTDIRAAEVGWGSLAFGWAESLRLNKFSFWQCKSSSCNRTTYWVRVHSRIIAKFQHLVPASAYDYALD